MGPRRWAELRFAVVGPLLASPPRQGELQEALCELASRHWRDPVSGTWTTFGASTIERWYYLARDTDDPIAALSRKVRSDRGVERVMRPVLLAALRQQYKDHAGWSYKLHADNLAALARERDEVYGSAPSYATVRRRMVARGWRKRRRHKRPTPGQRRAAERLERLEVRSFEVAHVHALWHYDFHEGSRRIADANGEWHTPFALCILDDRSRLGCHMQWYLVESSETLIHGLTQAFHKRGLPREVLHDNGGAMMSEETQSGLKRLGIISSPTLAYSPYQNGKQETFWSQVEGRLLALLEGVENLSLAFLNRATQAWIECEYNRSVHEEIGEPPLERMLKGPDVSRKAPGSDELRVAFTRRRKRTQRRSDGTVSIEATRFELPSRLRTLEHPIIRYRKWDLSRAWVVDPRTDDVLATIRPLDRLRNADGRRRTLEPLANVVECSCAAPVDTDPVPALLRGYLAEYAATGLPPAYLPKEEGLLGALQAHPDHNHDQEESDA